METQKKMKTDLIFEFEIMGRPFLARAQFNDEKIYLTVEREGERKILMLHESAWCPPHGLDGFGLHVYKNIFVEDIIIKKFVLQHWEEKDYAGE